MPDNRRTYRTESGRELTDEDIWRLADDLASSNYDVATVNQRRHVTPSTGDAPTACSRAPRTRSWAPALDDRVEHEGSTRSEIIRRALRDYLAS